MITAYIVIAVGLTTACAGGRDGRQLPAAREHNPTAHGTSELESRHVVDAGIPLSEAAARTLLAAQFRAAGLRVLYDVRIVRAGRFDLTVDGYDPDRNIGFEYVAVRERNTDLNDNERHVLARDREHLVLIIDAGDASYLSTRAAAFLARIQP